MFVQGANPDRCLIPEDIIDMFEIIKNQRQADRKQEIEREQRKTQEQRMTEIIFKSLNIC